MGAGGAFGARVLHAQPSAWRVNGGPGPAGAACLQSRALSTAPRQGLTEAELRGSGQGPSVAGLPFPHAHGRRPRCSRHLGLDWVEIFFSDLVNMPVRLLVILCVFLGVQAYGNPGVPHDTQCSWPHGVEARRTSRNSGTQAVGIGLELAWGRRGILKTVTPHPLGLWGQPRFSYLWHDDSPWPREVF